MTNSPKAGSSLYYSLLWTDEDARQRLVARLNLIFALVTTLDDVQDPNVAQTKIHWWHEELERMAAGQARHPAVQPCQHQLISPLAASPSSDGFASQPAVQACLAIVSAASTNRFNAPDTNDDVDSLLTQGYTARMALLSHALSEDDADLALDSHPASSALALARHEQLSRLPQLIHRGQPVFSSELYQQHNIRPTDLATHIRVASSEQSVTPSDQAGDAAADTQLNNAPGLGKGPRDTSRQNTHLGGIPVVQVNPNRAALLADVIEDAHAQCTTALADVAVTSRYRRAPLLPLWRLLVLREKQLALWAHSQPDLLRERNTLTPLRKLYWAWRNRR